ncbi:MAG TPA: hypothetical protein VK171_01135, partial [Fimbriimonas sp.]|nr:hypothetical protein [Fimbriimonas sp.]
ILTFGIRGVVLRLRIGALFTLGAAFPNGAFLGLSGFGRELDPEGATGEHCQVPDSLRSSQMDLAVAQLIDRMV